MTRTQIEAEQFSIGQRTFALEQSRKTLQDKVLLNEDILYGIQERREAILLRIRGYEENIDKIKNGAIATAEKELITLQGTLSTNQTALDVSLATINQKKLDYEATQIALDAWSQKQDIFNKGPLKTAADLTASIYDNFKDLIEATTKDITIKIKAVYEGFKNFATNGTTETTETDETSADKTNADAVAAATKALKDAEDAKAIAIANAKIANGINVNPSAIAAAETLLGRGLSEEQLNEIYKKAVEREKSMPVVTKYAKAKGGGVKATTTGGADTEEFLYQEIAKTDEAKQNKIFGLYDAFKTAIGVK
jgi:hypothetical protein